MDNNQIQVNTVKPDLTFYENENQYRLLSFEGESSLDSKISDVEKYMTNNAGQGLSDTDKDSLYAEAQKVYTEYKKSLRDVKFNLYLNRNQYNFITDLLLKKLEYDVNTVFIAMELTKMLENMEGTKYKNDTDLISFSVDPTELTYLYHLIQPYKVKGLTREAYTFSRVLVRIGELSKVINYYDAYAKSLTEDIQKWALKMDEVVKGETLKSEVVES